MKFDLEERACKNCGRIFRTLKTSQQEFCSRLCEEGFDPVKAKQMRKAKWAVAPKALPEEKNSVVSNTSGDGTMSPDSQTKNANASKENIIKQERSEESQPKQNMKEQKPTLTLVELSGEEKTETDNLQLKGNTMPKTENVSKISSSVPAVAETRSSGLENFSSNLRQGELASMNLIDSAAKHLHDAMHSIVKSKAENEMQNYNFTEVESICKLADSMKGLLEVKVSAVKNARKLVKMAKEMEAANE